MKKTMIANRRFTYGTRRLVADDTFDATAGDARVLVALGHARIVGDAAPAAQAKRVKPASQPVQQPVQEPDEDDDGASSEDNADKDDNEPEDPKAALVKEARSLGIDADESWGMKRLRKEIKAAKAE